MNFRKSAYLFVIPRETHHCSPRSSLLHPIDSLALFLAGQAIGDRSRCSRWPDCVWFYQHLNGWIAQHSRWQPADRLLSIALLWSVRHRRSSLRTHTEARWTGPGRMATSPATVWHRRSSCLNSVWHSRLVELQNGGQLVHGGDQLFSRRAVQAQNWLWSIGSLLILLLIGHVRWLVGRLLTLFFDWLASG